MKNTSTRLTYLMTFAVLAGFAVILAMNATNLLGIAPSRYLSPNDVKGIAVEHANKLYTLNFDQQNKLVEILNRSIPVGKELVEKREADVNESPDLQKIIIYRFNAPDLELIPITYVSKSTSVIPKEGEHGKMRLVYSVPEWNKNGLLEESTTDDITSLLSSTYGP